MSDTTETSPACIVKSCPHCGKSYGIQKGDFLRLMVCAKCGRKFRVGVPVVKSTAELSLTTSEIVTYPFRKRAVAVMCKHCGRVDVLYLDNSNGGTAVVACECGNEFRIADGEDYLKTTLRAVKRTMSKLSQENKKVVSVQRLHERFKMKCQEFEEEWAFFHDPKSKLRIDRIKDETDRLYKKLGSVNSEKLLHAQHTTTRSNIAVHAMDDHPYVSFVAALSAFNSVGAEVSASETAGSLKRRIDRNEDVISRYNDLIEEFYDIDKETARVQRLTSIFGFSDEASIPSIMADQDGRAKAISVNGDISVAKQYIAEMRMLPLREFVSFWTIPYIALAGLLAIAFFSLAGPGTAILFSILAVGVSILLRRTFLKEEEIC